MVVLVKQRRTKFNLIFENRKNSKNFLCVSTLWPPLILFYFYLYSNVHWLFVPISLEKSSCWRITLWNAWQLIPFLFKNPIRPLFLSLITFTPSEQIDANLVIIYYNNKQSNKHTYITGHYNPSVRIST